MTKSASTTKSGGDPDKYLELSRRLRAARERSGLSLRALASRLDISPSALSQIETGRSRPSVGSLYAITSELGVSLDSLFESDDRPSTPQPSKKSRAPDMEGGPVQRAGARRALDLEAGVRWERLTAAADPEVDFLWVAYEPGGASSNGLMRHSGKEYGLVLDGELHVTVGFETHVLAAGDSISFDSTTPHRLANEGDTPVLGVWVVIGRRSDPRAEALQESS